MVDNAQTFNNKVVFRHDFNDHEKTGHNLESLLNFESWYDKPGTPLLIVLAFKLMILCTRPLWYHRVRNFWLDYDHMFIDDNTKKMFDQSKTHSGEKQISFYDALSIK
jgi:hypothetical protein